jgi:putative hydrolase of the HAD superfamily
VIPVFPIKAILFDLDNTLIDRDAAVAAWLATVVPAERVAPLVELDRGSYGPRPAVFAAIGEAAGFSAAEAYHRFIREIPGLVRLRPDADQLLARLSVPAILVTNGPSQFQRAKIATAGLAARTAGIVVSSEVGAEKPAPAIFHRALELATCAAHEAVMVGDHPVNDIAGAQAVGISTVMVRSRWFAPPAGVRAIDQLTELPW